MENQNTLHLDKRASFVAGQVAQGDPDQLLTTNDAADLLGVSPSFLHHKRQDGNGGAAGPPFKHPFGNRTVRYHRGELLSWVKERDADYRKRRAAA